MHPVSKKCIQWAVALIVVGAVLMVLVPQLYGAIATGLGPNASIGVGLLNVFLTLVRWTMLPVGASLIGAAVVIQVLAPADRRSNEAAPPTE